MSTDQEPRERTPETQDPTYRIEDGVATELTLGDEAIDHLNMGRRADPEWVKKQQELLKTEHGLTIPVEGHVDCKDGVRRPIVSFLYEKWGEDGLRESERRVVILTGWGKGVHPDHFGQAPAEYLVGVQIGKKNYYGQFFADSQAYGTKPIKAKSSRLIVS